LNLNGKNCFYKDVAGKARRYSKEQVMNLTLGSNTTTSSNQGYQIFSNNEKAESSSTQIFAAPSVNNFGGESAGSVAFGGESAGSVAFGGESAGSIAFGGESAGSIASLGTVYSSVSSFGSFSGFSSCCSSSGSCCSFVA
jgi:hypothetical protein